MHDLVDGCCDLLGDDPCFICSSSASSGCSKPHVGDLPSSECCGLVPRRRQQMARSATRRARPTIPPTEPPAIAAVLGFGAGEAVWRADWLSAFAVCMLSEPDVELAALVDAGNEAKLLGEEVVVLEIKTLMAEDKTAATLELKL